MPAVARRYAESVKPVPMLGSRSASTPSPAKDARMASTTGPSGGEALPAISGSGHVSS